MEINSSDESCHHVGIPTLPFSEIKQTHATLGSAHIGPNASWELLRAGCEAASQWELSSKRCRRNTRGVLPWVSGLWWVVSSWIRKTSYFQFMLSARFLSWCPLIQTLCCFYSTGTRARFEKLSLSCGNCLDVRMRKDESHKRSAAASVYLEGRSSIMSCLLEGFLFFIVPTGKPLTQTFVSVFSITTKKSVGCCNPFV